MTNHAPRLATLAMASLCSVPCASLAAQTVFPTGTTIWSEDETDNGLTLFASPDGKGILIDMAGNVVNEWVSPIPGHDLVLVEPLPGGNILCGSKVPGQKTKIVLELDWFGEVVWAYTLPTGLGSIHHEVARLPNGNTLLLGAWSVNAPTISPLPLEDDYIIEITPDGTLAWSWLTYQHFAEFGFDAQAKQLISAQGGDWAHTNAVHPLPPNNHTSPAFAEGNLVVSQRFTNIVFIIDRSTGAIVWKVGPDNNLTYGQHAPYMIPTDFPGAGNLLVFDNGSGTGYPLRGRAPGFSRVLEIDPDTSTVAWSYNATNSGMFSRLFSSDIVSNAERLQNGNTLICSGVRGRLFEVGPAGRLVWEYMSPFVGIATNGAATRLIYRAQRVPLQWAR